MASQRRIGLIVNPLAGIGGPLAARGSDHFATLADAQALGGRPVAAARAERALRRLKIHQPSVQFVVASTEMGAAVAQTSGFDVAMLTGTYASLSTARDTRAAAGAMLAGGAEIILFAGGDGTARDIFDAVGDRIALVGIPTGVKMHSAVFAVSPEAAGETVAVALRQNLGTRLAEIMDSDPMALPHDRSSHRLFGYAATPDLPRLMQSAKGARPDGGEAAIEALGRTMARAAAHDELIILGPGTTIATIKRAFQFDGTLMGVDVVLDGQLLAEDADAATLEALCLSHSKITLITGIVGGQGFVFGRGNQQISANVIRRAMGGDIRIIATREKLLALPSSTLRADTGDADLDHELARYYRVVTGPNDTVMMRLATGL
jgi:predicted polyphosphate/ATP-dependent NAD kinase